MFDWKPKEEFRAGPHAKPFGDIAETAMFKAAISAAFLHYMANLPRSIDMGGSAANDYRRQGATAVLLHLLNLSQKDVPPTSREPVPDNLNHNA
jgi:hypothetical protein